MDKSLLKQQGFAPASGRPARLKGFGLRVGARATLAESANEKVRGMLARLDGNDLNRLYSEPSVMDHIAQHVVTALTAVSEIPALCYIRPKAAFHGLNREYAAALAAAAARVGLPADLRSGNSEPGRLSLDLAGFATGQSLITSG